MKIAYSGIEAIDIISKEDVDVIVLDIKMPGMEGIEALEKIKALKPGIEVVMLTAHGSLSEAMTAMKKDAHDFIMKPAPIDVIIDKITTAYEVKTSMNRETRQESRAKQILEMMEYDCFFQFKIESTIIGIVSSGFLNLDL